jgi:hypothetical protein
MYQVVYKRVIRSQNNAMKTSILPFDTVKDAREWVSLMRKVDKDCVLELAGM